jgi:hypothetical protein
MSQGIRDAWFVTFTREFVKLFYLLEVFSI